MKRINENCEQIHLLISAQLDNEISSGEQKRMEDHIAHCAECADLYADLHKNHAVTQGYIDMLRSEAPQVSIADAVMHRIEAGDKPKLVPFKKRRRAWWISSAVAASIILFLGIYLFFYHYSAYNDAKNTCVVESVESKRGSVMVFKDQKTDTTIIWMFSSISLYPTDGELMS